MTNIQDDELGDQIIRHGLAPNRYVLDLNQSLTVPYDMEMPAPWNLPSRLFRFPIEVSRPDDQGLRRIALRHPLLSDHPFVRQVATALSLEIGCGAASDGIGQWWHAVDLISAGRWRDLIATRQFTTDDDIARAVAYGLDYSPRDVKSGHGYISTADARELMRAIGISDAADKCSLLLGFAQPTSCKSEAGSERWPINNAHHIAPAAAAWGRIVGIETGWFSYDRAGFLGWSATGRDRYAAGECATFTEGSTGQGAFAF